jgi:hypothetical protein
VWLRKDLGNGAVTSGPGQGEGVAVVIERPFLDSYRGCRGDCWASRDGLPGNQAGDRPGGFSADTKDGLARVAWKMTGSDAAPDWPR